MDDSAKTSLPERTTVVKLGHETVEVEACNRDDAIKKARRALCGRWPRLWDVIMAKPNEEFQCESLS